MTAETGHVFVLSAGRRAAFLFELRHECSSVRGACAAFQLFYTAENCGEVLSLVFGRAKRRWKKRRRNL